MSRRALSKQERTFAAALHREDVAFRAYLWAWGNGAFRRAYALARLPPVGLAILLGLFLRIRPAWRDAVTPLTWEVPLGILVLMLLLELLRWPWREAREDRASLIHERELRENAEARLRRDREQFRHGLAASLAEAENLIRRILRERLEGTTLDDAILDWWVPVQALVFYGIGITEQLLLGEDTAAPPKDVFGPPETQRDRAVAWIQRRSEGIRRLVERTRAPE